jgi:hypothetical protein
VQAQGGQAWPPLTQAGQAQPQPLDVEPVPEPLLNRWQTPELHGPVAGHAMPSSSSIQTQLSALSAVQVCALACAVQGSGGIWVAAPASALRIPVGAPPVEGVGTLLVGVVVPPVLPDPTGAAPVSEHLHVHGGHVWSAAQMGHAQAQVPPPPGPPASGPPPLAQPPPPVPPEQSQLHGGQVSPGAHAGQAQVHVPPPEPLPPSAAGCGGQSHATAGQPALAGQASGWAHAQPLPEASTTWQNPPLLQSLPTGQRIPSDDQAHPARAAHAVWSGRLVQVSGALQTPEGHEAPAGQATPSAAHEQPFWVSAVHAVTVVCAEQLVTKVAGIC